MKCPHWLIHNWNKWEQYQQTYTTILFPGELIQRDAPRTRIREKRRCETCGKMQDRVVVELHQ